jgi:NADH-quinone oxidoreductase subunit L
MHNILLAIVLAPLAGAILAGLFGKQIGRKGSHWVTILGVATAFVLSAYVFKLMTIDGVAAYNETVYNWATIGNLNFEIGFLVDNLTAMMMVVVTFVSLMVHIYTIGYMSEDPGYQRFFSYIALFTFAMLMLVMANNFLQLFFGWEAVGLVSYLLIGFWYKKPTAIYANMKAFLVNRIGDFGFLIGIAAVMAYFGTLDYATVFANADEFAQGNPTLNVLGDSEWSVMSIICIGLFIGAMGKSAQVPLHVWLPDSMEGPTPISALIHAATMVTAGVFMVARMSPLFELSETALSMILIVGATTALFMGFLGVVQNDIKRVVAYSTLSQLGYMVVALGASAYAAGVFHLMTHAFFKALLFLAAGSVIIGMHHEQDMRKMGGLRKYMPITYITMFIGSLALIGTPLFAGFYSKDMIIEAAGASQLYGSGYAYFAVMASVFVTALYSFRLIFMVFHGKEKFDDHTRSHLKESPAVVWVPLVLLAIPSVVVGAYYIEPMLFGGFFDGAIVVAPAHDVLAHLKEEFHGPLAMAVHAFYTPVLYMVIAGVFTAWLFYMKLTHIPAKIADKLSAVYNLFVNKYYFDDFNQKVFAEGAVYVGKGFSRWGDQGLIDGVLVNGSANSVGKIAGWLRGIQTGYLYHYAFAMLVGLIGFFGWIFLS